MKIYNFNNLVGNTTTIKLIRKSLSVGSFPKVALMSGMHGTGKSTSAAIVAMSLTCPSPINGEACLQCTTCKNNMKALESTGVAQNIVKKDLGKIMTGEAMLDIIKEIFVLQTPVGNNVYILEEAQGLSMRNQTALLEEIDRLDPNTYIILTTTRRSDLLDALLSRSIEFNFNPLSPIEQKLLFDRTCADLGIKKPKPGIENLMLRYTKGVPRDLVLLIDFVAKVSPTEQEIAEFLNFVDTDAFISLMESMQYGVAETIPLMEELLYKYETSALVEQFKGFIVDVMFLTQGNIAGHFNKKQKERILKVITPDACLKLCKLVDGTNSRMSTNDFRLLLIKACQFVQGKKISDIVKENTKMASQQQVQSTMLHNEVVRLEHDSVKLKGSKPSIEELKSKYKVMGKVIPSPTQEQYVSPKEEDVSLDLENKQTEDLDCF